MNKEQRAEEIRLRMDRAFREVLQLSSTKEVKSCCNVAIKLLLANDNSQTKEGSDEYFKFWKLVAEKINR
tara:strand:- start:1815 stop:2024 length:210 start_codon:yes stop_codon:yes gene_type:complete